MSYKNRTSLQRKEFYWCAFYLLQHAPVKNHHFFPQHYYSVTRCHICQGVLWGIGNQGYQCASKSCCGG